MAISYSQLVGRLKEKQAKDLLKRGLRVQGKVRQFLGGAGGHIQRINTGTLRSGVGVQLRTHRGSPSVRVGSGLKYARWVHDGTGIYGPKRQKITPRTAKALVFPSAQYGAKRGKFRGKVVVRSVKGMRRNQFLKDALPFAKM